MSESGRRLRAARERIPGKQGRPLSREALAGRVGVVTSTLQKWERVGLPYADEYAALAKELGVTIDSLLTGTDEPWDERTERRKGDRRKPAKTPADVARAVVEAAEPGPPGRQR